MQTVAGFSFGDHQRSWLCQHVYEGASVRMFVHGADGILQFLCGADGHERGEQVVAGLCHVLERNPDLASLPTVDRGFEAERDLTSGQWMVCKTPQGDPTVED